MGISMLLMWATAPAGTQLDWGAVERHIRYSGLSAEPADVIIESGRLSGVQTASQAYDAMRAYRRAIEGQANHLRSQLTVRAGEPSDVFAFRAGAHTVLVAGGPSGGEAPHDGYTCLEDLARTGILEAAGFAGHEEVDDWEAEADSDASERLLRTAGVLDSALALGEVEGSDVDLASAASGPQDQHVARLLTCVTVRLREFVSQGSSNGGLLPVFAALDEALGEGGDRLEGGEDLDSLAERVERSAAPELPPALAAGLIALADRRDEVSAVVGRWRQIAPDRPLDRQSFAGRPDWDGYYVVLRDPERRDLGFGETEYEALDLSPFTPVDLPDARLWVSTTDMLELTGFGFDMPGFAERLEDVGFELVGPPLEEEARDALT